MGGNSRGSDKGVAGVHGNHGAGGGTEGGGLLLLASGID